MLGVWGILSGEVEEQRLGILRGGDFKVPGTGGTGGAGGAGGVAGIQRISVNR